MRTMLYRTALVMGFVAAAMLLAGCEEVAMPKSPPTEPPGAPSRPANLDAIEERWGGYIALGNASQGRRASAVASNSRGPFPGESIIDARSYGACDVFDLDLHLYAPMSVLDCVDRTEQDPGHYHVAAICTGTNDLDPVPGIAVFIRASDRARHVEYVDHEDYRLRNPIEGMIAGEARTFRYFYGESLNGETVILNLADRVDDQVMYDLVRDYAGRGSGELSFSLTSAVWWDSARGELSYDAVTDTGRALIQSNDEAAVTEHTERCRSLSGMMVQAERMR